MSTWTELRLNGIPGLGFGTWPLKGKEAEAAVLTALETGFRHIDSAQFYQNEAEVGQALKASGLAREDVFLVSKLIPQTPVPKMLASMEASVQKMGGEPIDLMLMHWPTSDLEWFDAALQKLNEAQDQGLVKAIGLSNANVALMQRAVRASRHRIIANQVEFHPLLDQSKLQVSAHQLGIVLEAYCPLARGAAMQEAVVQKIAAKHEVSASEVVLAWIRQQGVIAVPMTTKPVNAASNFRSLQLTLTAEEMAQIDQLRARHRRLISPADWSPPEWD
jgi:diketogulonate reductase-like aldo/keto reductase